MHATTAQTGVKFSYIPHTKLVQSRKKSVLNIFVLPYSLNFTFALVGFGNDEIVYFIIYSAAQLHLVGKQDSLSYPFPHRPPQRGIQFLQFSLIFHETCKISFPNVEMFFTIGEMQFIKEESGRNTYTFPDFRKALAARMSAS